MGPITKGLGQKHVVTLSPAIAKFLTEACSLPLVSLQIHLKSFPYDWPLPRGDLYHWIPLLNRFDSILEKFIIHYGLEAGPQKVPFEADVIEEDSKLLAADKTLLLKDPDHGVEPKPYLSLVQDILKFSRMLLENCGNRSLYNSSERLSQLLNTTSYPLLIETLKIMVRLAQRYHASRQRTNSASSHLHNALLASHYNIDLEKVQQLTHISIRRSSTAEISDCEDTDPLSHTSKEEHDFLLLLKQPPRCTSGYIPVCVPLSNQNHDAASVVDNSRSNVQRRTSSSSKPSSLRNPLLEGANSKGTNSLPTISDNSLRYDALDLEKQHLEHLMWNRIENISPQSRFEMLHELRLAEALLHSDTAREDALTVKLLAITNLAYVYTEETFKTKLLIQDSSLPPEKQLVSQLCLLVQNASKDQFDVPPALQVIALGTLDALARIKSKQTELNTALNVGVNHGVLFFLLRKAIADIASETKDSSSNQQAEWRDAVFALLETLSFMSSRTSEALMSAGLLILLIQVLNLRNSKANKVYPKILTFLNGLVGPMRDAFQVLANANGLVTISNLMAEQVETSLRNALSGHGMPAEYRSRLVDYRIPFYGQQTLRMIFKIIHQMMTANSGNFDRLLRNFIDTPNLLGGLNQVIKSPLLVGASVWSGAVNIMSSFIHNHPASYAIISEAGLSSGFFSTVSTTMKVESSSAAGRSTYPKESSPIETKAEKIGENSTASLENKIGRGILPVGDAIVAIPHAFGALCLNASSIEMLKSSDALHNFFSIFVSAPHVLAMAAEVDLPQSLGRAFEELVRHQPDLKDSVIAAVLEMVDNVKRHCLVTSKKFDTDVRLDALIPQDEKPSDWNVSESTNEDIEMQESGLLDQHQPVVPPTKFHASKIKDFEITKDPAAEVYINVCVKFLFGFAESESLCGILVDSGTARKVLEMALLPILSHDFTEHEAAHGIQRVILLLSSMKPHLVLPLLVDKMKIALKQLKPLQLGNFQSFVEFTSPDRVDSRPLDGLRGVGTNTLKALLQVHVLCTIFIEVSSSDAYGARSRHTFNQVNLADQYMSMIISLGYLNRACVWEEICLLKRIPGPWVSETQPKDADWSSFILGDQPDARGGNSISRTIFNADLGKSVSSQRTTTDENKLPKEPSKASTGAFRNATRIRYLLSRVPSVINMFSQCLGHLHVRRRGIIDIYLRQNVSFMAKASAKSLKLIFEYEPPKEAPKTLLYSYWIVNINYLTKVIIEDKPASATGQILILLLQAFHKDKGLEKVTFIFQEFLSAMNATEKHDPLVLSLAVKGITAVLKFYLQIVAPKAIIEARQSKDMHAVESRPGHPYYFHPVHFLVEIQNSVLPVMKQLWNSQAIERLSSDVVKMVIEILQNLMDSTDEKNAPHWSPTQLTGSLKPLEITNDKIGGLVEKGISDDIAREALYRCMGNSSSALAYAQQIDKSVWSSMPIPEYERSTLHATESILGDLKTPHMDGPPVNDEVPGLSNTYKTSSSDSGANADRTRFSDGHTVDSEEPVDTLMTNEVTSEAASLAVADESASRPNVGLKYTSSSLQTSGNEAEDEIFAELKALPISGRDTYSPLPKTELSTNDNDKVLALRNSIRENLYARVLDILTAHDNTSYELSDLIKTATSLDEISLRKEIGDTLTNSLTSFELGDEWQRVGKQVAAYSHLLALILQQPQLYDICAETLRDRLDCIVNFIKLPALQSVTGAETPWLGPCLLVIEKVLAEDCQPRRIDWDPPGSSKHEDPSFEPLIGSEVKSALFENIMKLMPCVGRDDSLALSISRVMVILTRYQELATRLSEKKNMQRFFLMIRQLAGVSNEKLKSAVLCILRHIFENRTIIRQTMVSGIVAAIGERSSNNPMDMIAYTKELSYMAIRAPEIFAEETSQLLEFDGLFPSRFDQPLRLRTDVDIANLISRPSSEENPKEDAALPSQVGTDARGPVTSEFKVSKAKSTEPIIVVENPSGIISYLLNELLNYKDIHDNSTPIFSQSRDENKLQLSGRSAEELKSTDSPQQLTHDLSGSRKLNTNKIELKSDQHPIHTYRCFLFQCITELVKSYNQAKLEFVNYMRRSDGKLSTPSKSRHGILHYLLYEAIPLNSIDPDESLSGQKREVISTWAIATLVALCVNTSEYGFKLCRGTLAEESQSDLSYVRKIVLDATLKAYKDVTLSDDTPEIRYGRLMSLADFCHHLLEGHILPKSICPPNGFNVGPQKLITKMMFERNFIAALTNSVADVNLSQNGADRLIEHVLRPLKVLTISGDQISRESDISFMPDPLDDSEEDSSVLSVPNEEEEREETPDLFRHSTLGMFDPNREDESSSESSRSDDDEMYDEEYDEEEDYEDDMGETVHDEVVSDEDEELDVMGPIEGMLGDPMDVEVIMDEDEDEDASIDDEVEDEDDDEDEIEIEDAEGSVTNLDSVVDELIDDQRDEELFLEQDDEDGWEDEFDEDEIDPDEQHLEGGRDERRNSMMRMMLNEMRQSARQGLNPMTGGIILNNDIDEQFLNAVVQGDDLEEMEGGDDEEDDNDDDDDDEEDDEDDTGRSLPFDAQLQRFWPFGVTDVAEAEEELSAIGGSHASHRHHQHHHRHHTHIHAGHRVYQYTESPDDAWPTLTGGNIMQARSSEYRSGRYPGAPLRSNDDGSNPLLRRHTQSPASSGFSRATYRSSFNFQEHLDRMPILGPTGTTSGDSPVVMLQNLIAAIGENHHDVMPISSLPGTMQVRMDNVTGLPEVRTIVSGPSNILDHHRVNNRSGPASVVPRSTFTRWYEEANMLFGPDEAKIRAQRVVRTIQQKMVPHMLKKQVLADKEKQEKKEKHAAELASQEQERREATAAAPSTGDPDTAQNAVFGLPLNQNEEVNLSTTILPTEVDHGPTQEPMEGVELQHQDAAEASASVTTEAGPTEPATTREMFFNGIDISDIGIDPAYLEALPEEMRNEVVVSQLALQRIQASTSGDPPTSIGSEFLEALPAELRAELLQQEAQERRRQRRLQALSQQQARNLQRQAEAQSPTEVSQGPQEMDTATFLASLEPQLRQRVLMEQDEDILAQLPEAIAQEARALGSSSSHPAAPQNSGPHRVVESRSSRVLPQGDKKSSKKQAIQMLDKSGIAVLIRLMLVPQKTNVKVALNEIMRAIAHNKHSRSEVLTLILAILEDGNLSQTIAEKPKVQMSTKGKQPAAPGQYCRPPSTDQIAPLSDQHGAKETSLVVIQQCLSTLLFLVTKDNRLVSFFLTESTSEATAKSRATRKVKASEFRDSRYPISILLNLLNRPTLVEDPRCIDTLACLLQQTTSQLLLLNKVPDSRSSDVFQEQLPGGSDITSANQTAPQSGSNVVDGVRSEMLPSTIGGSASQEQKGPTPDQASLLKNKTIKAPLISEESLGFLVNIIVARECTSSTFRATLTAMANFCTIPANLQIFGRRLVAAALKLASRVRGDLDDLISQLHLFQTSSDLHAMALNNFSPHQSDQAKLLRVLKALDFVYFYNPGREGRHRPSFVGKMPDTQILTELYKSDAFMQLWEFLSQALHAIRQGDEMLNVATILLPLVESLMVVCSNTKIKEIPLERSECDITAGTSSPETQMEVLFFKFTEDHRRILNDLVRQSPKLMSGTFQLLVKNPKVLEFDNKRNYFNRQLHQRSSEARQSQNALQVTVRRKTVFMDSYLSLAFKLADEIKYGKLNIRFQGEEGVDAGGVTREWFQALSRQMFNPDYALFTPVASDRTTFHPNKNSMVNDEHLKFFKFIGRIIGKALYECRALDCHFSRAVYKRILGKKVSLKDVETLDLHYYKSLVWILENDITGIITETMSVETDDFGVQQIVDLVPDGRNIPVTEDNKQEYVQLQAQLRLVGSVETQLENFLQGFNDIVPTSLISIFDERELELLISGLPNIDVDDWMCHTDYHNYQSSSPQIQWFWRAVRSFDKEEQAKLLQFVTGTSKVPLDGFEKLQGMDGFSRFTIHRDYRDKERLPSAHTCFNQLDLPEYEDYEKLRKQLYTAMTVGSEYFGFA